MGLNFGTMQEKNAKKKKKKQKKEERTGTSRIPTDN